MDLADPHQGVPPFLRWAGSKRKLLPKLRPYWEHRTFSRYVEPFMGSACLFFELEPERAVLGDINNHLVEAYRAVSRYTSRIQASQAQQQFIEGQKNLAGAVDKIHEAEAALRAAIQQRDQTEHESESSWRKDRADAAEKRLAAEQEILKVDKRRELQSLTSPIA